MLNPGLPDKEIILTLGTFKGTDGCGIASLLYKVSQIYKRPDCKPHRYLVLTVTESPPFAIKSLCE